MSTPIIKGNSADESAVKKIPVASTLPNAVLGMEKKTITY